MLEAFAGFCRVLGFAGFRMGFAIIKGCVALLQLDFDSFFLRSYRVFRLLGGFYRSCTGFL